LRAKGVEDGNTRDPLADADRLAGERQRITLLFE
jgi:hypothetical protein